MKVRSGITSRYSNIDLLKGIAIIFVLVTHFDWSEEQRRFFLFPFLINMAIPVFMIITGYVYSSSFKRKKITTLSEAYNWHLIYTRISRYTFPLVPIIIWELLDKNFGISMQPLDIIKWILIGTVGDGSYYYPIIMQLIFVFPVIYFIVDKTNERGLWICLIINIVYEILAWAYGMNIECYRLLIFRYFFLIAVGVYTFYGYKMSFKLSALLMVLGILFIVAITYLGYEPRILNKYWATTNFLASMLIVPIMIWLLDRKKQIHILPLEVIGKASYHIFLVQMVYYRGYYHILENRFSRWTHHLVVGVLICVILGVLYYIIEKQIRDVAKKIYMSHLRKKQ